MSIAFNKRYSKKDISRLLDVNDAGDMMWAKNDVETELKKLDIVAKVDVGLNGTGVGEKANEYYYKGVKISHDVLIDIINNA